MCLIALKTEEIKIAVKDITCYKIVKMDNKRDLDTVVFRPAFYTGTGFEYIKGQVYSTDIYSKEFDHNTVVFDDQERGSYDEAKNYNTFDKLIAYTQGFHSAANKKRLCGVKNHPTKQLVKCLIPKGSKYIISRSRLIISNQLIIVGIV